MSKETVEFVLEEDMLKALMAHRATEGQDLDFLFVGLGIDPSEQQRAFAASFRKQIFHVGVNTGWEAASNREADIPAAEEALADFEQNGGVV